MIASGSAIYEAKEETANAKAVAAVDCYEENWGKRIKKEGIGIMVLLKMIYRLS